MKVILILFSALTVVSAGCDVQDCLCPNITAQSYQSYGGFYQIDQPDGRLFSSEGLGCSRNLTCLLSHDTYFVSAWEHTNIPKPKIFEERAGIFVHAGNPGTVSVGTYVNLMDLFGIVCEDAKWWITKYPYGYAYNMPETMENVYVSAEDASCKPYKTEVKRFYCDGEALDPEFFMNL